MTEQQFGGTSNQSSSTWRNTSPTSKLLTSSTMVQLLSTDRGKISIFSAQKCSKRGTRQLLGTFGKPAMARVPQMGLWEPSREKLTSSSVKGWTFQMPKPSSLVRHTSIKLFYVNAEDVEAIADTISHNLLRSWHNEVAPGPHLYP